MKARVTIATSAAAIAVTTTEQAVALTTVPDQCMLSFLHGKIDTIASSAATITWALAYDSGGDDLLTDRVAETIGIGMTTATDGGVNTVLDRPHKTSAGGTAGSLWILVACDTGTCNLTPELHCQEG